MPKRPFFFDRSRERWEFDKDEDDDEDQPNDEVVDNYNRVYKRARHARGDEQVLSPAAGTMEDAMFEFVGPAVESILVEDKNGDFHLNCYAGAFENSLEYCTVLDKQLDIFKDEHGPRAGTKEDLYKKIKEKYSQLTAYSGFRERCKFYSHRQQIVECYKTKHACGPIGFNQYKEGYNLFKNPQQVDPPSAQKKKAAVGRGKKVTTAEVATQTDWREVHGTGLKTMLVGPARQEPARLKTKGWKDYLRPKTAAWTSSTRTLLALPLGVAGLRQCGDVAYNLWCYSQLTTSQLASPESCAAKGQMLAELVTRFGQ